MKVDQIKRYYPNAMTVHAAKGLEFDNVCVVDFNADDEESANVMFVALTRAKIELELLNFLML